MSPQANLMLIQQNFDKGNKVEFFKVFESFIPAEMKKKDFAYKKLEFFLQIYFVVYIKHPNISHQNISEQEENRVFTEAQGEFKNTLIQEAQSCQKRMSSWPTMPCHTSQTHQTTHLSSIYLP